MRIDSHHHFWDYSAEAYPWISEKMSKLRHDFKADHLKTEIAAAGLDGVVSVQARQSIVESDWLLEVASTSDFVKGVVGWVPLANSDVRSEIERLSHFPLFKSVRHVVQDEPDDAFILGANFNRGVSLLKEYGLVYDILIFARQLSNSIKFVDQHPEQEFVLDHIAKPTIVAAEFDKVWATNIRELAKRPNVTCKFSALVTEVRDETWTVETLRPYWDVAIEAFTPDRLMFGSDWPVCLLRSEYQDWVAAVEELSKSLSPTERTAFWGGTAARAYQLT